MNSSLAILITAKPDSSCFAAALDFCESALASGNSIYRIFFYHDAVLAATTLSTQAQDETNTIANWQQFLEDNSLDAVACIASCLKRGIIDEALAKQHQKNADNLHSAFSIAGLGQWVEAAHNADRHIVFGA